MSENTSGYGAQRNPAGLIIDKFGGLSGMARAYPLADGSPRPVTTVQSWRDRGRIPQDHWVGIQEAALRQGMRIDLADFLQTDGRAA